MMSHQSVLQMCPRAPAEGRNTVALLLVPCARHAPHLPFALPPPAPPGAPPRDSRSGKSPGANSWLMVTCCSLVTSETMRVDLRRSSMWTDCHSPVKSEATHNSLSRDIAHPGLSLSCCAMNDWHPEAETLEWACAETTQPDTIHDPILCPSTASPQAATVRPAMAGVGRTRG
uniref:Uncharacterized protein n=1 Tax=Pan paniscus TaxID=9597 RepID=A0A2R9BNR4_PANPA